MINNVQNRDEKPNTNPATTDVTCCDPNAPSEIRVNPFSWFTNDPPDLCGDFSVKVTDNDIKACNELATREPDKKSDSEHFKDFMKSLEPYEVNPRVLLGKSSYMLKGQLEDGDRIKANDSAAKRKYQPVDDRIIADISSMYSLEKTVFSIVESDSMFLSRFELPACEFMMDKNPSDWLGKECLMELRRVARLLYSVFEDEYEYLNGNIIGEHEFAIERYLPISHRNKAVSLIWDYKEKMDSYQFFEKNPEPDEVLTIKQACLYLLEASFYFIWNYKLITEKNTFNKDELLKGFEVTDDHFEGLKECFCAQSLSTRFVGDKAYRCNIGNDAFVYCRDVFTPGGEDSLEEQKNKAVNYASENGINIMKSYSYKSGVFESYEEDKPIYEMLKDMGRFKPSYLIVTDQSRLSNSMWATYHILERIACMGVCVLYVNG